MRPPRRSQYETSIRQAIATIAADLDAQPDLATLAATAALSPLYFHRIFTGLIGETPLELHRRLRIERAARQLLTTGTPIVRIAFDAGYGSHEAFTRAFHGAYGVSPRQWRRRGNVVGTVIEWARRVYVADDEAVHIPTELVRQGDPPMDVQIVTTPPIRVASTTHRGPYDTIGEAFGRVGQCAERAGLFAHPGTRMIAVYYDDPESTPADELRSAAGVIVPDGIDVPDGLDELVLPGGTFGRTTYVGPYSGLGQAWAELMGQWLPQSGHTLGDGVSYEMYLNSPNDTSPDLLRTELHMALA